MRTVLLGSTVLAVLGLSAAGAAVAAEVRLTQPVNATGAPDESPGRSYTSPGVVVDPSDPKKVYAGAVEIRSQRCALLRSADGGRTWTKAKEAPSPPAFPFCTHDSGLIPMSFVAMGQHGTLYFLHVAWDTQDGGRSENRSVFLARSGDGGDSWRHTPVHVNRGKTGNDIEKNVPLGLAVDTRGDTDVVYASYRASWPNPASPARPNQTFLVTSTNGGGSFDEPVNVSDAYYADGTTLPAGVAEAQRKRENFGASGGIGLGVDDQGAVYVPWQRSTANITPAAPASPYFVAKSTDRGRTFTMSEALPALEDQLGPSGPTLTWGPGGGPVGTLHLVWEGKVPLTQGDRDVLYRRSVDGGRTWSDTKTLNDDDPSQLYAQHQPGISVAPNGRVDVAWFDQRDNGGRLVTDVYTTHSTDFGLTWAKNERVTDRPIDRNLGVWKPGTGGDVRQPVGVGSSDELTYILWDDTRNGDQTTQQQDIYASTAQYEELEAGGLPAGAGYALAAFTGVAVVGLLLFGVSLATRGRRRAPPPPPSKAEPGREPAQVG
ncbi:MAG TPA: sialidase family protein [Acidimicrobiales bacterium]|nr:sialidase family protein [Acidimicrobiales bacterium]